MPIRNFVRFLTHDGSFHLFLHKEQFSTSPFPLLFGIQKRKRAMTETYQDDYTSSNNEMKLRKEAFVTGHEGSEYPWEVLWVCSSVLWGCWLYAELTLLFRNEDKRGSLSRFLIEALLVWFPVIVAQSNYLYPMGSLLMLAEAIIAAALLCTRRFSKQKQPPLHNSNLQRQQEQQPRLMHLTMYRSSIYFLTFVAILAVDFPLFPRRFCKTEVAGYGLMDVGAASFVISSGIVAGKTYTRISNKQQKPADFFKPLFKAAPLIIIGIIRCVTNKELEYQEHVSEYGVHWNFFFTLGVLAIVPTIRRKLLLQLRASTNNDESSQPLAKTIERWVLWSPVVAMVLYQYELVLGMDDSKGLQQFILTAPRSPLLDCKNSLQCIWMKFFYANREGILGCIGYSFLHAMGEWIGHSYVFATKSSVWSLGRLTLFSWMALWALDSLLGIPVSRRTTNLPFCIWAVAHNLAILWGFQILTKIFINNNSTSILGPAFGAVNRHGMVSFLVANLLTGLVNLLIPTIDQGDSVALAILSIYLLAVGAAALLLDSWYGKKSFKSTEDSMLSTKKKAD